MRRRSKRRKMRVRMRVRAMQQESNLFVIHRCPDAPEMPAERRSRQAVARKSLHMLMPDAMRRDIRWRAFATPTQIAHSANAR